MPPSGSLALGVNETFLLVKGLDSARHAPMTRLDDLETDALVKGLVGKEAVRMIGAHGLVDPEARVVGTNWTGMH